MHATISNFSSSGFSSLDISAETYDQILKNIYNMGLFLNFSNDYLAYIYIWIIVMILQIYHLQINEI